MDEQELVDELKELRRHLKDVKDDKHFRAPLPIDRAISKVEELIKKYSAPE